MKTLLALLWRLRSLNLAIIFLCQWLPYFLVLRPAILRGGGIPALDGQAFWWITLNTVLTASAGYLINDIFDAEIDARNKPKRVVVGKYISRKTAFGLYMLLILTILCVAFFLDRQFFPEKKFLLTWLFAGISVGLFFYSKTFKCTPLLGNILVATLCAAVPLMVFFPESRPLQLLRFADAELHQRTIFTFYNFVVFAFVTTLFREMVKDIEDYPGDADCDCRTLPVLRGIRRARRLAAWVGIGVCALIGMLIFYWFENGAVAWKLAAGVFLLLVPMLFASLKTRVGQVKNDFWQASQAIKFAMLAGMILLVG